MEKINIIGDDGICTSINKHLSRYQTNNEDLRNSLKEGYLWFSDPMGFNDPYDCNMGLGFECTYQEIYEYLYLENLDTNGNVDQQAIENRAKFLFGNLQERKIASKKSDQDTVNRSGICCFSQRNDSLLMWSHYGHKHTGVCLTFDIVEAGLFGGLLFNLEYPKLFPVYNWPRDKGKFHSLRFLIATKSKEWEYEDEIRIVRDYTNPPFRGKVKFNKTALKAVHFGYKCSSIDLDEIRNLLTDSGGYHHVKLFKAVLKEQEFGISYNQLD
jgi:hypothetical protein